MSQRRCNGLPQRLWADHLHLVAQAEQPPAYLGGIGDGCGEPGAAVYSILHDLILAQRCLAQMKRGLRVQQQLQGERCIAQLEVEPAFIDVVGEIKAVGPSGRRAGVSSGSAERMRCSASWSTSS